MSTAEMIWDLLSVFQDFQVHFIDLFRKLDQLEILKDIQFWLRDIGGIGLEFATQNLLNIKGITMRSRVEPPYGIHP